jgi:ketosteroid isomerase-like protein
MKFIWISALSVALVSAAAASMHVSAAPADDLKAMETKYWQAWEKGPDAAEPMYAKDAGLVFYDLEPLKYAGWSEYKAGVGPNILSKFDNITFTVNDDVKATVRGSTAWTSATVKGDGALKGGSPVHVVMRHTTIWEKRGGSWLIVHEHVSVPSSLPAPATK